MSFTELLECESKLECAVRNVNSLSRWTATDIGGFSCQRVISMPALTKKGIFKYDYSYPKSQKIVHEICTRFDAGDDAIRGPLWRTAVQHALLDATTCEWYR
jgi:hypothetical protein